MKTSRHGVYRHVLLCVASLLAVTAHAQLSRDPLMNLALRQGAGLQSMADNLGGAIKSAGELSSMIASASARVASARDRYWAAYPNGPGFQAAKTEFDAALRSKDYFYLLGAVTGMGQVTGLVGGSVDDGIPYVIKKSFDAWTAEVTRNLLEDSPSMLAAFANTERAREKIIRADPHYHSYVVRRNLEEFRRAGKTPSGVDAEAWRIMQIGAALTVNPPEDPYTTAFVAVAEGKTFASRCPAEISAILHKQLTAANCVCLRDFIKNNVHGSVAWELETDFTAQRFLIASVAGAGTPDKVAACVRK
jgi:hypothetical protein